MAVSRTSVARFLAQKLRAGVAHALGERQKSRAVLGHVVTHYRAACETWRTIVQTSKGVYRDDLTYGREPVLRGHWADRLPAIEKDLAAVEKEWQLAPATGEPDRASELFATALAAAAVTTSASSSTYPIRNGH